MFPPPTPWTQIASVDPNHQYVAFTSRFFLKSPFRVLAFIKRANGIMRQTKEAPGLIGWSLGFNLFTLEFHTLSAWEDADSLRRFIKSGDHHAAMAQFEQDMRRSTIFVYYTAMGRDLPLDWKDAITRQTEQDHARSRVSK